jgi:hypothetical protein
MQYSPCAVAVTSASRSGFQSASWLVLVNIASNVLAMANATIVPTQHVMSESW